LAKLEVLPSEVAEDLPGGEWHRIQKSKGYKWILVNGEITFEDGKPTGALPGRSCGMVVADQTAAVGRTRLSSFVSLPWQHPQLLKLPWFALSAFMLNDRCVGTRVQSTRPFGQRSP
jgi:hypothetical protein